MEYDWPGNIRELQNIVERAVIMCGSDTLFIAEGWLRPVFPQFSKAQEGLSTLAMREVEMIESALAQSNGRISGSLGAAMKLRIPRQTLESKIKRLGIGRYGHRVQLTGSSPALQAEAATA
jgi:formate hydrogenlyase transcriptional activator